MSRGNSNRNVLSGRTLAVLVTCVLAILWTPASAQEKKKKKELKPEPLTLTTGDGVVLETTWYPSDKKKEAVPVVFLHDWDGQKGDYRRIAAALQKMGYSVLVPDLRGHGQSTRLRNPDAEPIDRTRMNKAAIASIRNDIRACKRFLVKENNKGNLNIEKLCIVGAGVSTLLAMDYAVFDWTRDQLPNYKRGHDTKALVLLSPKNSYKGLTNTAALRNQTVRGRLSVMILVGEQSARHLNDAKRLHKRFERYHPPVPETRVERIKKQDLFLVSLDTKLQGTKLLAASGLQQNPAQYIANFLKYRLQDKDIPWAKRRSPPGGNAP